MPNADNIFTKADIQFRKPDAYVGVTGSTARRSGSPYQPHRGGIQEFWIEAPVPATQFMSQRSDSALAKLTATLAEMRAELAQLATVVEAHSSSHASWLTVLPGLGYAVVHPIPVQCETFSDDSVSVTWVEASVVGQGNTVNEAIADFEAELRALADDLLDDSEDTLDVLPKRWRRVLAHHLAKS